MPDTALITIHYDGENEALKNHKMALEDFAASILAFNNMIVEISRIIGIRREDLMVEITPLTDGGIKVNLIVAAVFIGSTLGGKVVSDIWDGLHMNQRIGVETVIQKLNMFIDRKNDPANENSVIKLTNGLDAIDSRIMQDSLLHDEAEIFTGVLGIQADYIGLIEGKDIVERKITKEHRKLFSNPYIISGSDNDADVEITEKEMLLRLDGPHLIGSEWTFKDQNSKSIRVELLRAEVLDPWLIELGRGKSLHELEDRDLRCVVREKKIKANRRRATINRYIIKSNFADDHNLKLL